MRRHGKGDVVLETFAGDGLRARVLRGTGLTLIGFGGAQVLRLAGNLVLTRILFPEVFGLMALVQVFMTGLQMFSDMGLRTSVIQNERGDDPLFLGTAFTLQLIRGIILWLAACALALPAANFYEAPMLAQLLPIVGLNAVISGTVSMNAARVNRHMMLGRLTTLELGTQALGLAVMVVLALIWGSVWALVVGGLFASITKAASSHAWLPGGWIAPSWDISAMREMIQFGKYIFLGTLAGFLVGQGDRAILGAYVRLDVLALYNIAFFLATVPLLIAHQLSDRVLFPLYRTAPPSKSAENRRRILHTRLGLTGGVMALATVTALFGVPIIELLYDPRYHDAGSLLVLLSLASLPAVITAGHGTILLANGNSRDFTILMFFSAVFRIGLMIMGMELFGLVGLILLPALASALTYPLNVVLIRRYDGWVFSHDVGFLFFALMISGLAIWLNAGTIVLLSELGT